MSDLKVQRGKRCAAAMTPRRTPFFIGPFCAVLFLLSTGCGGAKGPAPTTAVPAGDRSAGSQIAATPDADSATPHADTGTTSSGGSPKVTILDEAGVKEQLAKAKGRAVVINVWATYCVPCVEEMPELIKFYNERDPQNVEYLSLSADIAYTIDEVLAPFVAENKLPFPVYVPRGVPPDVLAGILGATDSGWNGALPATFLLDREGRLRKSWFDVVTAESLNEAVNAIAAS